MLTYRNQTWNMEIRFHTNRLQISINKTNPFESSQYHTQGKAQIMLSQFCQWARTKHRGNLIESIKLALSHTQKFNQNFHRLIFKPQSKARNARWNAAGVPSGRRISFFLMLRLFTEIHCVSTIIYFFVNFSGNWMFLLIWKKCSRKKWKKVIFQTSKKITLKKL